MRVIAHVAGTVVIADWLFTAAALSCSRSRCAAAAELAGG
jgi:hypothetical protein